MMPHRFIGRFEYAVDAKGRVNLPSRFRKSLASAGVESLVLCLAPDKRLRLYPNDVWVQIEARYAQLPSSPQTTNFLRALYQSIEEVDIDGQGRVKLPHHLMAYAEIEKHVVLVGFSSEQCIELCAPEQVIPLENGDFNELFYAALSTGGQ